MKLAEQLHSLLEDNLSLADQVALLKEMLNEPLSGQVLFDAVEYLYEASGQHKEVYSAVDIVGTGGDGQNLFNISTASSFVIAGVGVPVLKHGNTSVSSRSGSIDCLKALAIKLPDKRPAVLQQFQQTGISFLFAPQFYPLLGKVKAARQELAKQVKFSIFNILGPLLNPLRASHQFIGVARSEWIAPMAEALFLLGRHGLVFCCAGTDELIPHVDMQIMQVDRTGYRVLPFDYQVYGFAPIVLDELIGGFPAENAQILLALLQNQLKGPIRDVVLFNAAFAIAVYLNIPFDKAYIAAEASINTGNALAKLQRLQENLR